MTELLAMVVASAALAGGVLLMRATRARQWQAELVAYEVGFPRGVDPEAVVAFFSGLAGLVAPRWLRPVAVRAVAWEVVASGDGGITHRLLAPRSHSGTVLAALRGALPNLAVTEADVPSLPVTLAGEVRLVGTDRPLAVKSGSDVSRIATAWLASLMPLEPNEQAVMQWVITPSGPVPAAQRPTSRPPFRAGWLTVGQVAQVRDADATAAAQAKRSTPLFAAACRLGVSAQPARARLLLGRLTAALHAANAPGAHLARRAVPSAWAAGQIRRRSVPLLHWPCLVNARELAALSAAPMGDVALPGLQLGGCRRLAPHPDLPTTGRVLALSNFPGSSRALAVTPDDSGQHLHVIGPTNVGKSTLLLNLATADMERGDCTVVIDPKGDLVTDLLDRIPSHRLSDVVLLDPADDWPVGVNLLAGTAEHAELLVDQIVGLFHQLFRAFWGPRTDDILRAALLTLISQPGMTLAEVPLLLTDPSFRRRLVGTVDDPVALGPFWGWYEGLSDGERGQAIGPVMNKLRTFLLRRRVRNVIGQANARFDFDTAIAERRIVLVSLAKGLLGDEAASLLGSLFITRLWQAIQKRAAVPVDQRHTVFVHVDEIQNLLDLPTSVGDLLAEARGLGGAFTLAHQHLEQLPPALRHAVLANARSRVAFQPSAHDAAVLARELALYLAADDLRGLGRREVVVTVARDARVLPPATGVTLPPPPPTGSAEAARLASRRRYAHSRESVEAAIRARHDGTNSGADGGGSVGRQRRQP